VSNLKQIFWAIFELSIQKLQQSTLFVAKKKCPNALYCILDEKINIKKVQNMYLSTE
jgi:hypothetical protein